MRNILNLALLVGALILSFGCAPNEVFHKQSRGKWISQKSYFCKDTLVLNNYSLYNSREELLLVPNNQPFQFNEDSISQVFIDSFKKLELANVEVNFSQNIIDSLIFKRPIYIRNLDPSFIAELAGSTNGKTILIPLIYAYNRIAFTAYFTSGGGFGDNGWYFITYLDLIVFIVKSDKVIYSRHFSYKSDQVWADTRSEIEAVPPLAAVKQEHWDELVRLAMEDYIKRLK